MLNRIRHVLVYCVVATVIGTVWTLGWARSQNDRSDLGYYPPEDPKLFQRLINEPDHDDQPVATTADDGR